MLIVQTYTGNCELHNKVNGSIHHTPSFVWLIVQLAMEYQVAPPSFDYWLFTLPLIIIDISYFIIFFFRCHYLISRCHYYWFSLLLPLFRLFSSFIFISIYFINIDFRRHYWFSFRWLLIFHYATLAFHYYFDIIKIFSLCIDYFDGYAAYAIDAVIFHYAMLRRAFRHAYLRWCHTPDWYYWYWLRCWYFIDCFIAV